MLINKVYNKYRGFEWCPLNATEGTTYYLELENIAGISLDLVTYTTLAALLRRWFDLYNQ